MNVTVPSAQLTFHNLDDALKKQIAIAREDVGVVSDLPWSLLWLDGPDVRDYLHNRTTSDVKALTDGQGQFSALLDRKAHLQAYFSLHRLSSDRFLMVVDSCALTQAQEEIKKYQIMERFTQTVAEGIHMLAIEGPAGTKWVQDTFSIQILPVSDNGLLKTDWGWMVKRGLTGETGYLLLVESPHFEWIQKQVQELPVLSKEALDVLRIEAGIPMMGVDMNTDRLFPETGLEQQAVSYTKGCYLGQETVARVKTYGAVQRALTGLVLEGDVENLPEAGSVIQVLISQSEKVESEIKEIGTYASACYSPTLKKTIVMAYLDKAHRVPGQVLKLALLGKNSSLNPDANPEEQTVQATVQAIVTMLPFYKNQAAVNLAESKVSEGLKKYADGDTETAITLLREALQLNPRNADVYESLGVILSKLDRYDEAIALMHELVALEPDRIMAHTNLSVYYMKLGDKENAEDEKAKAMLLQMKQAMKNSGVKKEEADAEAKRMQLTRDRIVLFEKALALNSEDPLANFGIGNAYLELKEFAKGIPHLEKSVAMQPNHLDGYVALGNCLEATGEKERAKAMYQSGLDVASKRGDRAKIDLFNQRLQLLS
jgi:folate-binding protein YgfZ